MSSMFSHRSCTLPHADSAPSRKKRRRLASSSPRSLRRRFRASDQLSSCVISLTRQLLLQLTSFVQIGYGPGASLILSCLLRLHELQLGNLVYSAVLISLPEAPSSVKWASARSVVAHELVNVWSGNDFVLAIAARLYTLSTRIAGHVPHSRDLLQSQGLKS